MSDTENSVILHLVSFTLQKRMVTFQTVYDRINVIVNLRSLPDVEIRRGVVKLISAFPCDLNQVFIDDIAQVASICKLRSCFTIFLVLMYILEYI